MQVTDMLSLSQLNSVSSYTKMTKTYLMEHYQLNSKTRTWTFSAIHQFYQTTNFCSIWCFFYSILPNLVLTFFCYISTWYRSFTWLNQQKQQLKQVEVLKFIKIISSCFLHLMEKSLASVERYSFSLNCLFKQKCFVHKQSYNPRK